MLNDVDMLSCHIDKTFSHLFLQDKPSAIELLVEIEARYGAHDGRVHTGNERPSCE